MDDTGTDLIEPPLTSSSIKKALDAWQFNSSINSEGQLVWWCDMGRVDITKVKEELEELNQAFNDKDIKEVADALTDILYVTYGAGHAFGINLDKCFEEVQNSNMSKLRSNGKPIYNESGKVMKGPNYFKPKLSKFIN